MFLAPSLNQDFLNFVSFNEIQYQFWKAYFFIFSLSESCKRESFHLYHLQCTLYIDMPILKIFYTNMLHGFSFLNFRHLSRNSVSRDEKGLEQGCIFSTVTQYFSLLKIVSMLPRYPRVPPLDPQKYALSPCGEYTSLDLRPEAGDSRNFFTPGFEYLRTGSTRRRFFARWKGKPNRESS